MNSAVDNGYYLPERVTCTAGELSSVGVGFGCVKLVECHESPRCFASALLLFPGFCPKRHTTPMVMTDAVDM
jgi:hypothetical protein